MRISFWKGKNILLISPESWGRNFVSKHHYATLLAEHGANVFFLNPPKVQFKLDFSIHTKQVKLKGKGAQITLLDYQQVKGLFRLPTLVQNSYQKKVAAKIAKLIGEPLDIVWSFDPYQLQQLHFFEASFCIYHAVDIHHSPLEKKLANAADCILASSHQILESPFFSSKRKKFINHGLAAHFIDFLPEKGFPITIKKKNRINVGYIGNLNYKYLNQKQLLQIIDENPQVFFHFIGPYKSDNLGQVTQNKPFIQALKKQKNTTLYGSKPSAELPGYLYQMDLFLMCYDADNFMKELANPHKILEYLSTGKPIITHYIDEYFDLSKKGLIEMATTNNEIPALFKQTVRRMDSLDTRDLQEKRKTYARNNSYEAQLLTIANFVKNP